MDNLPVGPGGKPPFPDPKTLDCLSTACQAAQAEKVMRTNDFILKCGEIAAADARASALLAVVMSIFGAIGAILGAVITAVGGVTAALAIFAALPGILKLIIVGIFVTLVATALFFLTLYAIAKIQVAILEGNLNGLRLAFLSAVNKIMQSCPTNCWGDLTLPKC